MSMSSFGVAIPLLLFFWKQLQDEHGFLELHGVDGAMRTACIVFDHFQDAGAAEALEHFSRVVPITALREVQGVTEKLTHVGRKRHQIFLAAPDPDEWFFFLVGHVCIIPEQI